MKKIGISFILLNIAVVLGSAAIISGIGFRGVEGSFFPICALVAVTYVPLCLYTNISNNKITDWIVARTVEKNVPKHNFENPYTIYINNATLMLDIEGGRIAYISNLNPWKFQLIYAKDINDIKKGYKNLLNTTNYVYFQFSYYGKVTKFPTFVSRELRSIETDVVQRALKKANICVDVLNAAKYGTQNMQKGRSVMALDLSFWKYEEDVNYKPYDVYVNLSDGKTVTGVAKLPIEKIRVKIDDIFSEWEKLDDNHLEFNDEMIEIFTTDQFVRFDCYGVSEDNMNKLIDIMLEFDCKLYDSSIDVRFD